MAYDAKAVANEFLEIAKSREDTSITPMKLQKLVYYAHGWYLALTGKPLINEQVEAWKYGPVVRSLFHEFKEYGAEPITDLAQDLVVREDGYHCFYPMISNSQEEGSQRDFARKVIEKVWEEYGKLSGPKLSNMTHMKDSPWYEVNAEYGGNLPKGTDIPANKIEEYFKNLLAQ